MWCERDFEVVVLDRWVSGKFDRVVIRQNDDEQPVWASILDFKTDMIADESGYREAVERYRPQMEVYRTSLSQMLQLEVSCIDLMLVFTSTGRVCDVDTFDAAGL